jgi:DNA-binding LytR/AlgR family response regulator
VTAYDQYAIEAFEVNAVDYLLKPVEASRLEQSIDRVKARMAVTNDDPDIDTLDDQRLERMLQQVSQRRKKREQIAIKIGEGFQLIPSEDIIYASLADDVITVVAGALTGTSNFRTLDELHSNLDQNSFWRVHRSHVVNINKVKEIVPWFSRNYILKMKDDEETEIPVSRAQTKRLREYLNL